MTDLRVTGPNSDGEYWLHIEAGGMMGGINLGASHGPMVQRLLDAAAIEAPVQEPDETAALRAKLAEVERELTLTQEAYDAAVDGMRKAEADRDEERKLADSAVASLAEVVARCGPLAEDGKRAKAVIARHASRRKE